MTAELLFLALASHAIRVFGQHSDQSDSDQFGSEDFGECLLQTHSVLVADSIKEHDLSNRPGDAKDRHKTHLDRGAQAGGEPLQGVKIPLEAKHYLPKNTIQDVGSSSIVDFAPRTASTTLVQSDSLDRWVQFCSITEAWDKVWKVAHSSVRTFVDISPTPELRNTVDFLWRYILNARKLSWLFKWVKEAQGVRAALAAPGDQRVARLRALAGFWFAGRWIFENLHIMTKALPNGKGNILKVEDPERLNRLAKFFWAMALLSNLATDLLVLKIRKDPETPMAKKLRRMRLITYWGDSVVCCNMMQIPQMVTHFLVGRERAFYDTFVGFNGAISGLCQCYFVYPATPVGAGGLLHAAPLSSSTPPGSLAEEGWGAWARNLFPLSR